MWMVFDYRCLLLGKEWFLQAMLHRCQGYPWVAIALFQTWRPVECPWFHLWYHLYYLQQVWNFLNLYSILKQQFRMLSFLYLFGLIWFLLVIWVCFVMISVIYHNTISYGSGKLCVETPPRCLCCEDLVACWIHILSVVIPAPNYSAEAQHCCNKTIAILNSNHFLFTFEACLTST